MLELSHIDPRSAVLLVMDYQVDALGGVGPTRSIHSKRVLKWASG
jgi:hypothetical protein